MAALRHPTRVLVHLKKSKDPIELASFTNCVLQHFDCPAGEGNVYAQLKDNRLIISNNKLLQDDQPVVFKHPSFCPVLNLQENDVKSLSEDVLSRGIDVGVSIILESCDGKILLSRRAHHLRTFPGIWVPPGGHVETDETLIDAGLRELDEETGLSLSQKDFVRDEIKLLALWESVFPPKLSVGLPKRHHIVVYFHAKLKDGFSAACLESKIKFDPGEVGACAWLDKETIERIVDADEERSVSKQLPNCSTFRAVVLDDQKEQCIRNLPLEPLLRTLPPENDGERVSTGTKFALGQYLKM